MAVSGAFTAILFLISNCETLARSDDNVRANVDTLRFVHVVYRHGEHGPDVIAVPDVPLWVRQPTMNHPMTAAGTTQVLLLGKYLRRRYVDVGYLSTYYNATELYVRSMDYDLAIISAMANLQTLYPPSEKTEWMKGMGWQLIPVHTVPKEDDIILWMDRPCPKAESVTVQEIERAMGPKVQQEHQGILNFLRDKTGYPLRTWIEYDNNYRTLNAQKTFNLPSRPPWLNDSIFNQTQVLYNIARNNYFKVPFVHRLRGAPLFRDISERTDQIVRSPNITLKYYAYATAAATMMGLLETWGVPATHHGVSPFEGSALMVELHERKKEFFVEVWYVNITKTDKTIRIPINTCTGHEYGCPLNMFTELGRQSAPATPADWFAECGIYSPEHLEIDRLTVTAEILGIAMVVFLILFVGTVVYALRSRRRDYTPIK